MPQGLLGSQLLYCEHYVAAFFCFLRQAISCILLMPGGGWSPPPPPAAFFGTGGAPPFFAGPFAPALGTGGAPPPPAFCFLRHAISLLATTVCVRRPRGEMAGADRCCTHCILLMPAGGSSPPSAAGLGVPGFGFGGPGAGFGVGGFGESAPPPAFCFLRHAISLMAAAVCVRQRTGVTDRCGTHCILLMPGGGSSSPPPPPGLGGLGVPAPDPFRAAGFGVGGFGESPPPAFCFLRHAISLLTTTVCVRRPRGEMSGADHC